MYCLKIKDWLKQIRFLLVVLSPALCKLTWGSECYLLVDGSFTAGTWLAVICLFTENKFKFLKKFICTIFIIGIIFCANIAAMSVLSPLILKYLPKDDEYLGFLIIIIGLFFCCLLVFWLLKDQVKEYEKYIRLSADCMTAIIAIVLLYDNYYGVSDIVKMLILNQKFMGIPIVIYVVRFFISIYVLNKEENSQKKIAKKVYLRKTRSFPTNEK